MTITNPKPFTLINIKTGAEIKIGSDTDYISFNDEIFKIKPEQAKMI